MIIGYTLHLEPVYNVRGRVIITIPVPFPFSSFSSFP